MVEMLTEKTAPKSPLTMYKEENGGFKSNSLTFVTIEELVLHI